MHQAVQSLECHRGGGHNERIKCGSLSIRYKAVDPATYLQHLQPGSPIIHIIGKSSRGWSFTYSPPNHLAGAECSGWFHELAVWRPW